MYSDTNCCYFFCFIYQSDSDKPWYQRNLCCKVIGWILYRLACIIGIAAVCVVLVLFLLGSMEVGKFIFKIVSWEGCLYDNGFHISMCAMEGFLYWMSLAFAIVVWVLNLIPVYYLYDAKTPQSIAKISVYFAPLFLVGTELLGVALTYILKIDGMHQSCNLNSYYGLMNILCLLFGMGLDISIVILVGIIYGIYRYVNCCCKNMHQIQNTYDTIESHV